MLSRGNRGEECPERRDGGESGGDERDSETVCRSRGIARERRERAVGRGGRRGARSSQRWRSGGRSVARHRAGVGRRFGGSRAETHSRGVVRHDVMWGEWSGRVAGEERGDDEAIVSDACQITNTTDPSLALNGNLQAATAATSLLAGRVRGDGSHVLDAANLEAGAGQRAERRLAARPGALGLVPTRGAHLDVKRGEAELLAPNSHVLRRKHRRVGGRLIAISLHLHATC